MTKKYISVFIPTYNGQKYIEELLEAVLAQEIPKGYKLEILVTDSGSVDATVDIIEQEFIDKVHFRQIPNSQYGHGKTRQQAAEQAQGEFILILSQDATPMHSRWLKNMVEPFFISDKVGAVYGRQVPRPLAVPTIKREVASAFASLGNPEAITLSRYKSLVDNKPMNEINTFFSDVNSCIRKDLIKKIPFRDVNYAEDQALARDLQKAGYMKAYAPAAEVWHSNEYSPRDFRARKFDEYIGLIDSVNYQLRPSVKSLLLGWIQPTIADWKFTLRDGNYGPKRKLYYLLLAIGYNLNAGVGKYQAAKYQSNKAKRRQLSLEAQRRPKT